MCVCSAPCSVHVPPHQQHRLGASRGQLKTWRRSRTAELACLSSYPSHCVTVSTAADRYTDRLLYKHRGKLGNLLDSMGSRIVPPLDLQIYFWPHLTLNFDLLTPKVDLFMPLPHAPLVPIGVKFGYFIFKISRSQVL